jgi:hypothetical protein
MMMTMMTTAYPTVMTLCEDLNIANKGPCKFSICCFFGQESDTGWQIIYLYIFRMLIHLFLCSFYTFMNSVSLLFQFFHGGAVLYLPANIRTAPKSANKDSDVS